MPSSLGPIPVGVPIVDKTGAITVFFRLLWQQLQNAFKVTPDVASVQLLAQTAAVVTTTLYATLSSGLYRISYYMRKTVADGVSSSLTFTYGWSESGGPFTESEAALTTDTTAAEQSGTKLVYCDNATPITFAVAYASNTPNKMNFRINVVVEQLA